MTDNTADTASAWLHGQHENRQRFCGIQPWPTGVDEAFAYRVQSGLIARRGQKAGATGGYKIGLTTPRMQTLCRGDRPISGVMFESAIRRAPARIALRDYVHLGIESEIAVRMARPLPTDGKVTRTHVAAAVGEVATAFELIEDRNADYTTLDWLTMAADNSWHAGLVLGPAVPVRDIADLQGVLMIDGTAVDRGSTRDVLGHPFDAVAWLANHLAARGLAIEAGHWISTGSIATIRFAEAGRTYRFTIDALPPVELSVVE